MDLSLSNATTYSIKTNNWQLSLRQVTEQKSGTINYVILLIKIITQIEKYAHRRSVILGIMKAHYNIVKTRPSDVNYGNSNAIAKGLTHAWSLQRCQSRIANLLLFSFLLLNAWKDTSLGNVGIGDENLLFWQVSPVNKLVHEHWQLFMLRVPPL